MKELEDRILRDGRVLKGDILQVGGFINQQIDTSFTTDLAREVYSLFSSASITKVLTIEASGIAFGFAVASQFGVPLVFAKKNRSSNVDGNVLCATIHSYTHGNDYNATVSAEYIAPNDKVLIADDFLANGEALRGLIKIVNDAGATVVGAAIEIEKGFQGGGDKLRSEGIRVESLAVIESMSESCITFRR